MPERIRPLGYYFIELQSNTNEAADIILRMHGTDLSILVFKSKFVF